MADQKNRESEFTVTDRRKFNFDDVMSSPAEEVSTVTTEPEIVESHSGSPNGAVQGETHQPVEAQSGIEIPPSIEEGWESPSEDDQFAQSAAYKASGNTLDSALEAQEPGLSRQIGGASFDRLVALISTQALLLMGALAPEGQQPRVDVVGARQQIDLLEVLKEKTKGNLDVKEQSMLDNTLFELRMMFIEIMNAFSKPQKREG